MVTQWRWDQGRLDYFRFSNIALIANVLSELDGIALNISEEDPIRTPLMKTTGLPFRPSHYKVWRNYSRVFSCSLLAGNVGGRLAVSSLCKHFVDADDFLEQPDRYFINVFRNFSYPHPAFQGYSQSSSPVYPFSAIIKFLLSRTLVQQATTEDIFLYLIGNQVTGNEDLDFYSRLDRSSYIPAGDETRQLREMMIFASQATFLKWFNNSLILDISRIASEALSDLTKSIQPNVRPKLLDTTREFFQMSSICDDAIQIPRIAERESPVEVAFTEGRRRRTMHLRTERSPTLRKALFASLPSPYHCDMCNFIPKSKYAWVDNILEVHHLLPLSSTVNIESTGTSLRDVVPICPNCHKSVHVYYRNWLRENSVEDFPDKNTAISVYNEAKSGVVL